MTLRIVPFVSFVVVVVVVIVLWSAPCTLLCEDAQKYKLAVTALLTFKSFSLLNLCNFKLCFIMQFFSIFPFGFGLNYPCSCCPKKKIKINYNQQVFVFEFLKVFGWNCSNVLWLGPLAGVYLAVSSENKV